MISDLRFRLFVYLVAFILTLTVMDSCKVKQKLVHKLETVDTTSIQKSDSTKVLKADIQIKKVTDSSKKVSQFKKDTKTRSYTEIDLTYDPDSSKFSNTDTSGNGLKGNLVNRILQGAKNVKIKIWDYQHKKESGNVQDQKALKTEEQKSVSSDSANVKKEQSATMSKKKESTIDKKKDSSSSVNWVGWIIGLLVACFLIWMAYLYLRKVTKI